MTYRVCFVCTGNICRSPMAEWVLRHRLAGQGLEDRVEVDSAGTGGWHVGEDADPRTVRALRARGYVSRHIARQWERRWFAERDLVVALDEGHARHLRRTAPDAAAAARVVLLREFDPEAGLDLDVPDPYYGDAATFDEVLDIVEAAMDGLLDRIRTDLDDPARQVTG